MDHVWNSLRQWEVIWEERLQDVKKRPDNEYNQAEIELLKEQLEAIRKAMAIVGKWN